MIRRSVTRRLSFVFVAHGLKLCLLMTQGVALAGSSGSIPPTAPLSLTLDLAVQQALAHNPQVAAARETVTAAEQGVIQARTALAPTLSATGTTSYGTAATVATGVSSSVSPAPTQMITFVPTAPGSSGSVGLTATLPFYDGGHTQFSVEQAEAAVATARAMLRQTQQDVALSSAQAFFSILKAERVTTVREAQLAQAQAQLAQAQAQVRAGVAAQADVIQARAQLAQAQVDLLGARSQIETAKVALRGALAMDVLAPVEVEELPIPPASIAMTAEAAIQEAAKNRPEIAQAISAVRENTAALALAYVNAGVQVTTGLNSTYVPVSTSAFINNTTSWALTATFSFPLSDGGKAQSGIDQAKANLRAAQAKAEAARQSVLQDAFQAYLAAVQAAANVEAMQAAATAAAEALRVAEGRYRAGVAGILEVTTARTHAAQTEVNAVTARYDYGTAMATLRHALGHNMLGDGL